MFKNKHYLTDVENKVLNLLKDHGPLTFEELKSLIKISSPDLRKTVAGLMKKEIITKEPDFSKGKFVYRIIEDI